MEQRFLGRILGFDSNSNTLTIQCDFLDYEKQKVLEDIYATKKPFSFSFKKPYKKGKSYEQLKKYHALLKTILMKLEIYSDSDIIKAFDDSVKMSALPCETIIVYDKEVPLIPSKADMTMEELSLLIQYLISTYGELLEDNEKNIYI